MDINKFIEIYWNYYRQLEGDFFSLEPFCAIDKVNDNAFSTKYLHLILSICGEIDTICKRMCSCIDPDMDMDTCGINEYKNIMMTHYPKIADERVVIRKHIYREVQPWQPWAHKQTPHWWSIYNKLKHHRDELWNNKEAYKYANQKTTIDALCALYIVLEYWAAYNFVLRNEDKNSYNMLQVKSKNLMITGWNPFYEYFMGNDFFASEKCRAYFNVEQGAVV